MRVVGIQFLRNAWTQFGPICTVFGTLASVAISLFALKVSNDTYRWTVAERPPAFLVTVRGAGRCAPPLGGVYLDVTIANVGNGPAVVQHVWAAGRPVRGEMDLFWHSADMTEVELRPCEQWRPGTAKRLDVQDQLQLTLRLPDHSFSPSTIRSDAVVTTAVVGFCSLEKDGPAAREHSFGVIGLLPGLPHVFGAQESFFVGKAEARTPTTGTACGVMVNDYEAIAPAPKSLDRPYWLH